MPHTPLHTPATFQLDKLGQYKQVQHCTEHYKQVQRCTEQYKQVQYGAHLNELGLPPLGPKADGAAAGGGAGRVGRRVS